MNDFFTLNNGFGYLKLTCKTDYLYFESAEANSTVQVKTMFDMPVLEYSYDAKTWTTCMWFVSRVAPGDYPFSTENITLQNVGDRVYFRGVNPDGLGSSQGYVVTTFFMTGKLNAGGSVTSLIDGDGVSLRNITPSGFACLFYDRYNKTPNTSLLTPPSLGNVSNIGSYGCYGMYYSCTSLTLASDMHKVLTIGDYSLEHMYRGCSALSSAADMSSLVTIGGKACYEMYCDTNVELVSNNKLTFGFPELPITTTDGATISTAEGVKYWMSCHK